MDGSSPVEQYAAVVQTISPDIPETNVFPEEAVMLARNKMIARLPEQERQKCTAALEESAHDFKETTARAKDTKARAEAAKKRARLFNRTKTRSYTNADKIIANATADLAAADTRLTSAIDLIFFVCR